MSLSNFPFIDFLINSLDIFLVWLVIYQLLLVIKGTKAVQLLKGIFVIIIVRSLSGLLGFKTLYWLMDQAMDWGFIAIVVIFQPELRRALEQIGRGKLFSKAIIVTIIHCKFCAKKMEILLFAPISVTKMTVI